MLWLLVVFVKLPLIVKARAISVSNLETRDSASTCAAIGAARPSDTLKEVIPVTYPVADGTFTSTKRDEVINAGTAGLKLTDQQIRQLEAAAANGNTSAQEALTKRGR